MRYRKLSPTGDYTLGTGQDFYIDVPDTVAQAVLTRLRLFKGEWFVEVTDGTPWYTDVLGKYTRTTYDAVVKKRILETPGVLRMPAYTSVFDSAARTLTITATIDTIYGTTTLTGTI